MARVPLVVIGDPETDKNAGTVAATLVTVPEAPAFDASSFTVPAAFLKYSFSSVRLMASSPSAKLPDVGTADAVVVR
jgi:hypothetical protein